MTELTLECLLIADGNGVDYYIGTDAGNERQINHLLHSVFPEETSIRTTERPPIEILEDFALSQPEDEGVADEDEDEDRATEPAVAIQYLGSAARSGDWQMQLQAAIDTERDAIQSPLTGIVDRLAATPPGTVAVFQAVLKPFKDWRVDEELRREDLRWHEDTPGQRLGSFLFGLEESTDRDDIARSNALRLEELDEAAPRKTWAITARLYIAGDDADGVATDLEGPFGGLDGDYYRVRPLRVDGEDAHDVLEAIRERRHRLEHGFTRRLLQRIPSTSNTRPVVHADPESMPAFWFLDGDALTPEGRQALDTTHGEQSGVTPPSDDQLDRYDQGLTLGRLLDADDEPTDRTVALPPALQTLHAAWFGKTGAGKSVGITRGIFDNTIRTGGPDIVIDSKGDGMAEDLLKAHYRRHGHLDNVYYFECDRFVPAISYFDVSDDIEAGVPRATAVEDKVDHYIEILAGIMGEEAFQSKRAPDIIRYLLKAMYDPVHGSDAFTQSEFDAAVKRMTQRQSPPAVSDPHLERMLSGVAADRSDVFQSVMQGVNGRIEKVSRDSRTARLFEHTPPESDAQTAADESIEGGPSFDLADHLDEDAVVILDTGGLRTEAQRALILVVLSNLWAALRKRERRRDKQAAADDPSLVNLYIEEAADIADTSLMSDLLAKSRGFGLSVTLAMQFPAQLRNSSPRVYDEVLNNVSTLVTGNVGRDTPLAERLATDAMPPSDVANRLRGLRRGQWLAKLPAGFDDPEPRPFLLASAEPPAGHPASDEPLSPARLTAFDAALHLCKERTREDAGLTIAQPSTVADASQADADAPDSDNTDERDGLRPRVDTTLPYTKRLPDHVTYIADRHALKCLGCDTRYDPNSDGMARVLRCCPNGEIDSDDIPICDVTLKLTREERRELDYTDGQLMFLKAVYNAAQLRYTEPTYDLLTDSMLRLREYVGIDAEAVDELLDDGLLRHDTDHPHRLYTVSSEGRNLLGEEYRLGVDHGHATGDLGESTQHIMGVEIARRWLHQEYVRDPESPVETIVPYFELDETVIADHIDRDESGNASRLDIAGLDADGEVAVCLEVERINNDVAEAVPADFDKMAACDPDDAIWVVMSQSAGHDVLQALNKSGRVEKTYAGTTPPQQFRIDEPGLTGMYPITWVRDRLA
ncbi:ATP-binding protein [Natronomonas gomsonensis]|uniref:ATP-binding protein n=1 Tax=Natronomonas gomsonensis TaxID=1046043 RepID=UPI0015BC94AA|nr:ATP-binding protein [Natronomonas gomsonensis]